MFKAYGPSNPHDTFQEEWLSTDIEEKIQTCETEEKEILDLISKYADKNTRMLEAGCGLGNWVMYLKRKGYNIKGIDFAEKVVELIKQYDNALDVDCGDCTKLPYADKSIDMYLSFGVIEHLEEGPDAFLKEAYRVLSDDGIGIITVPNEKNSAYYKFYSPESQKNFTEFFEYGFTEKEFIEILDKNGFEVLEIRYHDYFIPLGMYKIFKIGEKRLYKLNWLGKMAEKFLSLINNSSQAWMVGAVVRKKKP